MDFGKLMREANKMQSQMKKAQEELEQTLFEVETNGGAVKVSIYGNYKVERIDIDKDLIDKKDKEMLEDMLKIALNEAINKVNSESKKITDKVTSSIPGFPGM